MLEISSKCLHQYAAHYHNYNTIYPLNKIVTPFIKKDLQNNYAYGLNQIRATSDPDDDANLNLLDGLLHDSLVFRLFLFCNPYTIALLKPIK